MGIERNRKSSGISGWLGWLLQRITSFLLIIFASIHFHFYIQHFLSINQIKFNELVAILQNPFVKMLEIIFIICLIYHSLNGLTMIVYDFIKSHHMRVRLNTLIYVLSIAAAIFGIITIIMI